MMEEDLKLAQALARCDTSTSPGRDFFRSRDNKVRQSTTVEAGSAAANTPDGGQQFAADSSNIKTHASMVFEKVQGFRSERHLSLPFIQWSRIELASRPSPLLSPCSRRLQAQIVL